MVFLTIQDTRSEVIQHFDNLNDRGVGLELEHGEIVYPQSMTEIPLTFVALEDGTFSYKRDGYNYATMDYSLDNGRTWTTLANNTNTPTVSAGQKVLWRSNTSGWSEDNGWGCFNFQSTGQFIVEGNIMSLSWGDDFIGKTEINPSTVSWYESSPGYLFGHLFYNCNKLINAENMVLPATTLSGYVYCCGGMFAGCTSLTTAPELPATTLANSCYYEMFAGCTSLTKAPVLPATTLGTYCYEGMFSGCTSLTTAPELPATTLANSCYRGMFSGCTSLNYVKCLAETGINSNYSTLNWLDGVSSTGTFEKSPNATTASTGSGSVWPRGANGIPTNWTVQDA